MRLVAVEPALLVDKTVPEAAKAIVFGLNLGPEARQKAQEAILRLIGRERLMLMGERVIVPTERQLAEKRRRTVIDHRGHLKPYARGGFWNDRAFHGRPRRDRSRAGILVPASVSYH